VSFPLRDDARFPGATTGLVRIDVGHEEAFVTEMNLLSTQSDRQLPETWTPETWTGVPALPALPVHGLGDRALDDYGIGGAGVSCPLADEELGIGPEDAGPLPWQEQALCAQTDPEAFFPEKGGSTREAKRVCGRCDVRADCLSFALAHDERFGIWGGLSERERRRLKRRVG
jgi:WhiB family redox-sensing transcriptional regulator